MVEESQFLAFSGLRVHFKVVEPEGEIKNRVLLLSSPLISTFHWRKLVPELEALGCLCVLVDLPGFVRSDCNAPQDDEMRANLVWGVLDEVDQLYEAPLSMWHLMAHGSACGAILTMAAHCPDSVKTMIHVAPTFTLPPENRQDNPERWFDANVVNARRFHRLVEQYSGHPLDDYVVDRMRAPLLRTGARVTFSRMVRHAARPPRTGMGFCPTMALIGGLDPLMDETRLRQIQTLLPDAEIHRLRSAGHFPMETHSKAMRDYLRGWIRYNE